MIDKIFSLIGSWLPVASIAMCFWCAFEDKLVLMMAYGFGAIVFELHDMRCAYIETMLEMVEELDDERDN